MHWRFSFFLMVGFFSLFLQWFPGSLDMLHHADTLMRDKMLRVNAKNNPENRIVVIDIDENSLTEIGPWPWKRDILADLLETLIADYEVRHIGLDIVFPAKSDSAGDERLQALAQTGKVTLAQVFDLSQGVDPVFSGIPITMSMEHDFQDLLKNAVKASGYIANHEGLKKARCVGNIGAFTESDGVVRRVPLVASWEGRYSPLLPLAMLQCDKEILNFPVKFPISYDFEKAWSVEYSRKWESYIVISAADILYGKVDINILRNSWVLVGASALGLSDRVVTPLGGLVSGVMVHASVLSTLLDWAQGETFPVYLKFGDAIASFFIILSLFFLVFVTLRWNAWVLIPVAAACSVVWIIVAMALLRAHYVFQVMPPLWAIFFFFLLTPLEWWFAQHEQKKILRNFQKYVGKGVLQQMIRQGMTHAVQPRRMEIVVLSADMQGSTSLISQSSLVDAAVLTRGFLDCLTQPLLEMGGTLDKYMGDGLIGFWGAPLPVSQGADLAVDAALSMVRRVHKWNQDRLAQGLRPARVRIGIEMGVALVGDLGTEFRSTYTAVGDCVNAASKLQSAAKIYSHDIIIGARAAANISAHSLIYLGELTLPGFLGPNIVFTVDGAFRSLDGIN